MRFSGSERDDEGPWLTVGKLDVTTTTVVLLLWAATLLVYIADRFLLLNLALVPGAVTSGEVWRIVTWPWAHLGFGLGEIIGAALFWLFGTMLEQQIGRKRFAVLIAWSIVIISLSAVIWSAILPRETLIADLSLLELTVVLLYIAEHPTRPFFFNIPAWVIGAVIVALEVVNDLANREWAKLLTILVAAALVAVVARKVELLTVYDRIPDVRLPRRKRTAQAGAGSARAGRTATAPAPSSKRAGPLWGKGKDAGPAELIPMPQTRRRSVNTTVPDLSADDLALDVLLDKISAQGLDALTVQERQSLDELRSRRRKP